MHGQITRKCKSCNLTKPIDQFGEYKSKHRCGRRYTCRKCRDGKLHKWSFTENGQLMQHRKNLLRNFGMTVEAYDALLESQGGCCAICRRAETRLNRSRKIRRMSVDHDHVTGKVRSLLCAACNNGLGSFRDDPVLLQAALDYIKSHSTQA